MHAQIYDRTGNPLCSIFGKTSDFTEYIYHFGNVSETYLMTRSGLIPGGRSLKRDRQSVFFSADDDQSMEEIRYDLDKPKIASTRNIWRPHQKTVAARHIFTCTVFAQYRRHVFLGSRGPRAQDELCAKNMQSSTRHVPLGVSQHTEHQHKFSLTCLSCFTVVLFSEPRHVVHASIYPL